MRKSTKKLPQWHVIRLKETPAAPIGTVEAPDAESAVKEAIKQYGLKIEAWKLSASRVS
jgi:hypothetical protein